MKDTINRLARGEFMHEVPKIDISQGNLEQSLTVGKIHEKELKISGSHDYVKGLVYSDNFRGFQINHVPHTMMPDSHTYDKVYQNIQSKILMYK